MSFLPLTTVVSSKAQPVANIASNKSTNNTTNNTTYNTNTNTNMQEDPSVRAVTKPVTCPPDITPHDIMSISAIDACRTMAALSNNCPPDLFFRAAQLIHTFLSLRPSIKESFLQQTVSEANRDDMICLGAAALFAVGKPYTNLNLMRLHKIVKITGILIRRRRNWGIAYTSPMDSTKKMTDKLFQVLETDRLRLEKIRQTGHDENGNVIPQSVLEQLFAKYNSDFEKFQRRVAIVNKPVESRTLEEKSTLIAIEKKNREWATKACMAREHLPSLSASEETELNQRIVRWEWVLLEANAFVVIGPTPFPLALTLSSVVLDLCRAAASSTTTKTPVPLPPSNEALTVSVVSYLNDATRSAVLCTEYASEYVAIAAVFMAIHEDFYNSIYDPLVNTLGRKDEEVKASIPDGLSSKFWWAVCCLQAPKISNRSGHTKGSGNKKMDLSDDDDDMNDDYSEDEKTSSDDSDDDGNDQSKKVRSAVAAATINPGQVFLSQADAQSLHSQQQLGNNENTFNSAPITANTNTSNTKRFYKKASHRIKACIEEFKRILSIEFPTADIANHFEEIEQKRKQQHQHQQSSNNKEQEQQDQKRSHHREHKEKDKDRRRERKEKDHHHHKDKHKDKERRRHRRDHHRDDSYSD